MIHVLVTGDDAIARGVLAVADRDDRVAIQRGLDAPASGVAIVFADELEAYLAARPDPRRTLVVNAPDPFDVLERHGLGGAFACPDATSWSMIGHVIAHRGMFRREEGETMSGPGRESPGYICWKDGQYLSLYALVRSYAARCERFARRDQELAITPDQAGRRGLPPIGLRMTIGEDFMPTLFPAPGAYVHLYGWQGVEIWIEDDPGEASLEQVARGKHATDKAPPMFGDPEPHSFAGESRMAIACVSNASSARCYVHVPHRGGRLLVTIGCERVTMAEVLARAERVAETLRIS